MHAMCSGQIHSPVSFPSTSSCIPDLFPLSGTVLNKHTVLHHKHCLNQCNLWPIYKNRLVIRVLRDGQGIGAEMITSVTVSLIGSKERTASWNQWKQNCAEVAHRHITKLECTKPTLQSCHVTITYGEMKWSQLSSHAQMVPCDPCLWGGK